MKKRLTKAHRILISTKIACRKHIESCGHEKGVGFTGLITEEVIYTRTLNAVQKELDRWSELINECEKLGISGPEETTLDKHVAEMIQTTINNSKNAVIRGKGI